MEGTRGSEKKEEISKSEEKKTGGVIEVVFKQKDRASVNCFSSIPFCIDLFNFLLCVLLGRFRKLSFEKLTFNDLNFFPVICSCQQFLCHLSLVIQYKIILASAHNLHNTFGL